VTIQPTLNEPFFEMENAYNWFNKRHSLVVPMDLMNLVTLDPPPGYAGLQEERIKGSSRSRVWQRREHHGWQRAAWYHFRIHRERAAYTLAVILRLRLRRGYETVGGDSGHIQLLADEQTIDRVWLYEHRQGQGWVCLDPADDSHEVVQRLRGEMIMEALK
jgi:hypothetical protein